MHNWFAQDAVTRARSKIGVAKQIKELSPKKVFIDITGLGAGVYDRLNEMGYDGIVEGINFAQSPIDERTYANKRAEMWAELRDWLDDPAGVDIPDDDNLHTQFCAPVWGTGATRFNSAERIVLRDWDFPQMAVTPPR